MSAAITLLRIPCLLLMSMPITIHLSQVLPWAAMLAPGTSLRLWLVLVHNASLARQTGSGEAAKHAQHQLSAVAAALAAAAAA